VRRRFFVEMRLSRDEAAICSRKDRSAIVWGTAASPWDPDWRAGRRSHWVAGRHRVAGPVVVSKAGRKVRRCSADAAQFGFDSGLASALSRGTGRRATVSGKAASRCNPAVPQTLVLRSSWREQPLVQQRLALSRLPSGLD
jgi:hypothetical protein